MDPSSGVGLGFVKQCGSVLKSSDSTMGDGASGSCPPMTGSWAYVLNKQQVDSSASEPMVRRDSSMVNGERVMMADPEEYDSDVKRCEDLVIG